MEMSFVLEPLDTIINRIDPPVLAVVDQDICTDQQATLDAGVMAELILGQMVATVKRLIQMWQEIMW